MRGITDTVKHLIIINVLMFIGTLVIGNRAIFSNLFALHFPKSDMFQPWQIITHMFMHGNFQHILFNMLALWMFGTAVEQVFGKSKFIFFYLSSGLGAVVLTFIVYYIQVMPLMVDVSSLGYSDELLNQIVNLDILEGNYLKSEILERKMAPLIAEYGHAMSSVSNAEIKALFELNHLTRGSMVGASGAIMGILVAFGMLFPNSKLMLIFLPVPIKAKYFIPGLIALDLFSALTGVSIFSPNNTAYIAHIGGAITGFLMMYFWKKDELDKYRWN
ncbi:MAG: rhomboid family intramembrane serine protease [Flavobacteriaceae bacterium]|nr:rhomboid family intramembrane serine protease [Flavobacteriaceae bacterium]